jgi:hypothetical protein
MYDGKKIEKFSFFQFLSWMPYDRFEKLQFMRDNEWNHGSILLHSMVIPMKAVKPNGFLLFDLREDLIWNCSQVTRG